MKHKKLVYGVGINDADYAVIVRKEIGYTPEGKRLRELVFQCPYYLRWVSMLGRCYSDYVLSKFKAYRGCTTIPEWHYFMTFRAWMEKQDWEGKELDKDILIPGNRLYSPATCVFVDGKVNNFLTECTSAQGEWPVGVSFHKPTNKFLVRCMDVNDSKRKHLGLFNCPQEAHQAWLTYKLSQAHILAAEQSDPRVAAALIDRYENYSKYFPQPR